MTIAGLNTNPLEEAAVTAIEQGSGGLFRQANHLARGALNATTAQQSLVDNLYIIGIMNPHES